jgi:hypothetical protein
MNPEKKKVHKYRGEYVRVEQTAIRKVRWKME